MPPTFLARFAGPATQALVLMLIAPLAAHPAAAVPSELHAGCGDGLLPGPACGAVASDCDTGHYAAVGASTGGPVTWRLVVTHEPRGGAEASFTVTDTGEVFRAAGFVHGLPRLLGYVFVHGVLYADGRVVSSGLTIIC